MGGRDVEVLEQTHINNGLFPKPFPNDQGNEAHDGDHNQSGNEMRSEPVVFLSFAEHDLQCAAPRGCRQKAPPRFSGAKLSPRIDCAMGCKPPPNAPCMTRNRSRNPRLGAMPQRKELTVKNVMQIKKKRLRPSDATSHPLSGRTIALETK